MQDSRVIYGGGYPEMQMAKVLFAPPVQADCQTISAECIGAVVGKNMLFSSYSLFLVVKSIVNALYALLTSVASQ